jgi:hypothetical protein
MAIWYYSDTVTQNRQTSRHFAWRSLGMLTYRTIQVPDGSRSKWGLLVTYENGAQAFRAEPLYQTEEEAIAEIGRLTREAAAEPT